MLGDSSEFTPLDLLGSLALNAGVTHAAVNGEDMRIGVKVKGKVQPYTDFRFLGGLTAAVVGQFGGPMVRRAGHDAAVGLLGSFVSTEICRSAAQKRNDAMIADQAAAQEAAQAAMPPQLTTDSVALPQGATTETAPAGSGNWAYGW